MFKARPEFAFDEILADVGRPRSRDQRSDGRLPNAAAGAAFPFIERVWREASAWPNEAAFFDVDEPPPTAVEPPLSDDPEVIARELGLDQALSEKDLGRARRLFMWRHHPDRCEESQRAHADRRVAVANMLVDRERARLAGRRRS